MQFGSVYNKNNYNSIEEPMSEERQQYLLEREKMIRKRKIRNKVIRFLVLILVLSFVSFYLYKNYFRSVDIDPRIDKNSIHYATDLYYSDGRYYDEYLDDKEKKVYLEVLEDLKDFDTSTIINLQEFGFSDYTECFYALGKVVNIILLEHPDLFWYRTSSYEYDGGESVDVYHHLVTSSKIHAYFLERKLLRKIDEVASKYEDLSDVEKVEAVYTWLGETTKYSTIMTRKSGTAWSALLTNESVCAGFAAASQLLFQRLGVESQVVTGSTTGPHAWNFVKLDDGYYWYDSTVAGSVGKDSSFFYKGLLFADSGKYGVDTIDLSKYTFGTKYLRK